MSRCSVLFATLAMLLLPGQLLGQQDATEDSPTALADQRQEVLKWLESYVGDEILLKPEDLSALIDKVRSLSDDEFTEWLQETRRLRAVLQSPEWLETRDWMREFLAVQAIYSEEELEEFRVDIAKMTSDEVVDVVERIRRKHQSLIWMRRASERNRRASLSVRQDLMQQQRSAVPTGATSARFGAPSPTPTPRKSTYAERRNAYRSNIHIWPGGAGWWRW